MRVARTRNPAVIRELLLEDEGLWRAVNEGRDPDPEWVPEVDSVAWIALIDDEEQLRGFVLAIPRGRVTYDMHVAIKPEFWGQSKKNVRLGRMACDWVIEKLGARKLVAEIPEDDKEVVRYAQRVGFKREGVNKKSYLRDGEMHDQLYLGMVAGE